MTFATKRGAQDFEEQLALEREAAGLADAVRFGAYAAKWLDATATAVRHATDVNYRIAMRVRLVPTFGEMLVHEITTTHVKDWVVKVRTAGLSKKTVSNYKGVLHACHEAAREDGIIRANPAAYRGKSKVLRLTQTRAERRQKVKALDAAQLRAFMAAAAEHEPELYPLFYALFALGLRLGEGLALQWKDVDHRGRKVRVARGITILRKVEPPKAGEEADVDMSPRLSSLLRAHERRERAASLASGEPRWEWIFPDPANGEPRDHFTAERAFRRVVKLAELPAHFTPHCLRQTIATQLLLQGESIYYVQRSCGTPTSA